MSIWGSLIGGMVGFSLGGPFGMLLGAFFGAFFGELIHDSKDTDRALKASFGAFVGFLASATIKFSIAAVYLVLFLGKVWEYKSEFF